MSTTQPKDLMTLEEVIKGIETLRFYECGSSNRTVANLYDAALHHLEAGKDKRYTPQDMIFAAAFGINKFGENFPELKSTAPTAQEVKG